jgi:tetratricopeptide (TPR) repeat protein
VVCNRGDGSRIPATVAPVSPRTRVSVVVAAAAVVVAGAAVGVSALQSSGGKSAAAAPQRKGLPPLELDLGVRTDPEAVALRRASTLYSNGNAGGAAKIFGTYSSLEAQLGAAFAAWPRGSLSELERLARAHPRDPEVLLNLGLARYWAGRDADALAAWRLAAAAGPDTASGVRSDDLLHPGFPRGLPYVVSSYGPPAAITRLPPAQQLVALAHRAATGSYRDKLIYGIALQRLGHPVSAERQFVAAAALAPNDPEAQVAAAVGSFSKAKPSLAFSRLGPLARRFPRSPTVRFHLGLLLLWLGQLKQARAELRLAVADGPGTELGKEAARFLQTLRGIKSR